MEGEVGKGEDLMKKSDGGAMGWRETKITIDIVLSLASKCRQNVAPTVGGNPLKSFRTDTQNESINSS